MTATPAAQLEGPIPVTATSTPYRGAEPPPLPAGYVEEEYFASGEVDGQAYRTSVLARRPTDATAFSGVVIVETLHNAGNPIFYRERMALPPSHGHGYVVVASQKSPVELFVKPYSTTRYADLHIPNPEGDDGDASVSSAVTSESDAVAAVRRLEAMGPISNEILSQVGRALKDNAGSGPFAGLDVGFLIMGGASQTGGATLAYMRDAQADARMPDGSAIYDGFFPMIAAFPVPVGPCDAAVVHALGEGDIMAGFAGGMAGGPVDYRRADSDTPDSRYRLYEVAGASHISARGYKSADEIFPQLSGVFSDTDELSQYASNMIYVTALRNLIDWVTKGLQPPHGEPIKTSEDGAILRDDHGNALGGVRLPQLDVPIATYAPSTVDHDAPIYRRMIGLQTSFPKDELARLYPDHDDYVRRTKDSVERLLADRWIMPEHAQELVDEAEHAAIP